MTPIERQILKNQADIMFWISKGDNPMEGYFGKRIKETIELLSPEIIEESACDMEECVKRGRGE